MEKIIVAGDSAGGNLAAALTLMTNLYNSRVPDGLLLCYPVLNLETDYFTPSYLKSTLDPLFSQYFLQICKISYIESGVN